MLKTQSQSASINALNSKHRKTLAAIFGLPTSPSILFSDVEALVTALGGVIHEQASSRVKVGASSAAMAMPPPAPRKEAKRYQVEEFRDMLVRAGVMP